MNEKKLAEIKILAELERIENATNIIIRESVIMSPDFKNKYVKKINIFASKTRAASRQSASKIHVVIFIIPNIIYMI